MAEERAGVRAAAGATLAIHVVMSYGFARVALYGALIYGRPARPPPPRARVMACISEPLLQRALEGSFNERLLYRLNAIHLVVPPDAGER